jgi:hypothetical protein
VASVDGFRFDWGYSSRAYHRPRGKGSLVNHADRQNDPTLDFECATHNQNVPTEGNEEANPAVSFRLLHGTLDRSVLPD